MKKLLYIDACIRGEASRTRRIAEPIVKALSERYEVERLCLGQLPLSVVDEALIKKRLRGEIPPYVLSWAESVRDADRIVIAAPFWDMSFPAALKNFIELCSIFDVTFKNGETACEGNCRAEKMLYITSRGMDISTGDSLEQATPYLRAISYLWGVGPLSVISMQNVDYSDDAEIERKIERAIGEGLALAEMF